MTSRTRRLLEIGWVGLLMGAVLAAARWYTIPGLIGLLNDDGLYALYARALASGAGYVTLSVPGHPTAARYPIGFPAILALVIAGTRTWPQQIARLQWVGPISAALYAGLAYGILRGIYALRPSLASAIVGLIAANSDVLRLAGTLSSDFPGAVFALGGLAVWEVELRGKGLEWPWLLLGSGLLSAACLVRYAEFGFLVPVVLLLAWRRRWRALAILSATTTAWWIPWMWFRKAAGGGTYVREYLGTGQYALGALWDHLGLASRYFLGKGLPGLLAPGLFEGRDDLTLASGVVLSALVVAGALAAWRSPVEGQSSLAPMILLLTMAVSFGVEVGFLRLEDALVVRLLMPVAPLIFLAAGRGLDELSAGRQTVFKAAVLAALSLSILTAIPAAAAAACAQRAQAASDVGRLDPLFSFLRRIPADRILMGLYHPMIALYTGHFCYELPLYAPPSELPGTLRALHVSYVIRDPVFLPHLGSYVRRSEAIDYGRLYFGSVLRRFPGLLTAVYRSPDGSTDVYRVNQAMLGR